MFDWFPRNISTYGGDIDSVFYLILYIVGVWFVVSEGLIFYFIFRYRRRPGVRAAFISGEKWKQAAWILIPAALVLILDLGIDLQGAQAYEKIKGDLPKSDLTVHIHGKQFNWEITYPGPDGQFETADDLREDNELNVPVDSVVEIVFTSGDVIHSFFVPTLRLKQDLVPGRKIPGWFEATETGTFEIACAELCGFGHYTMRGVLVVHSAEDYRTWERERWPDS